MRWLVLFLLYGCFSSNPCASVTSADLDRGSLDTAQAVPVENGSALWKSGTLSMDAPEAWYTYNATAGIFNTIDPFVKVEQGGLVVCAYQSCAFSQCPGGTYDDVAPNGAHGCCASAPIEFQIFGCGDSQDTVWMSVTSPHAETAKVCAGYKLGYNW
ncbi:MAG: hypothetical protein ACM31C_02065 [Acidobacteriota bacterium]